MSFDQVSLRYSSPNWLTGVHLARVAFVHIVVHIAFYWSVAIVRPVWFSLVLFLISAPASMEY